MAYNGKYPERIAMVYSAGKVNGGRVIAVETNAGARFNFVPLHVAAPIPEPGQEIEGWIFFVGPVNQAARDLCEKYGVAQ